MAVAADIARWCKLTPEHGYVAINIHVDVVFLDQDSGSFFINGYQYRNPCDSKGMGMPFWNEVDSVLGIFGHISTILVVAATVCAIYLCVSGFVPVLIRLGNGLTKRKIAIFAKGDPLRSLQALFEGSDLFRSRNVLPIPDIGDLGRAEKASLFLVYWPDWANHLPEILSRKGDRTALIVYAPQGSGPLSAEAVAQLEKHRNVVLANLRGRLLNDIVTSLITTGYEKAKD